MKALLEKKKQELMSQLEQSQSKLQQLNEIMNQTKANISSLYGALQVIDELSKELEVELTKEVKEDDTHE